MEKSTAKVALLGIGLMGSRMARNLLTAGFPLTAWNRDRTKAAALVAQGATVAEGAAEAAANADVVITMLATTDLLSTRCCSGPRMPQRPLHPARWSST